jgi:hypothetical protein
MVRRCPPLVRRLVLNVHSLTAFVGALVCHLLVGWHLMAARDGGKPVHWDLHYHRQILQQMLAGQMAHQH